jgi:hypothetical protein
MKTIDQLKTELTAQEQLHPLASCFDEFHPDRLAAQDAYLAAIAAEDALAGNQIAKTMRHIRASQSDLD